MIIQFASSESRPRCIEMCPVKESVIDYWKSLQSVKDIQGFLGFANSYWRFIKNFTKLTASLTALTIKDNQFQ